jgi:hypothetical protein
MFPTGRNGVTVPITVPITGADHRAYHWAAAMA